MTSKGMSQTLALIVAAMVLMMTALTLIFMTQGSLQDLFTGSEKESCFSTVKAKCSIASPGAEIDRPNSCDSASSSRLQSLEAVSSAGSDTVTCSE